MRIAIIGSRTCPYIDIAEHLPIVPSTIISGGAKGADTLAKQYALHNKIPLIEFLPDYQKFGRKAPLLRNISIVENCDLLIAFWDGVSRGTKFTIDYAVKNGVKVKVIDI